MKALVLLAGTLLVSGVASAATIIQCSLLAGGINTVNDQAASSCAVDDKLFQFIGSSSDNVYIGNVLNAPPGLEFYGATQTNPDNGTGDPNFPILIGPVDIEYIVSVIDPFNSSPNPLVISSSAISSLINGTSMGSLGGTVSFCVGQAWDATANPGFNGSFTGDDGCAANGGALSSMTLASANVFDFNPTTRSVAVWDHIILNSGAGFGTEGETFSQSLPTPEPVSLALFGSGILAMGLIQRKLSNKNR